jgi:hypothetical protein
MKSYISNPRDTIEVELAYDEGRGKALYTHDTSELSVYTSRYVIVARPIARSSLEVGVMF